MLIIYKQKGETPLQALHRLKKQMPEIASMPMTYAGRLDPMAEGVMVVLVGEECKNKDAYLGMDKTYVTEILFGVGTDTADILGKISASQKSIKSVKFIKSEVEEELRKKIGKQFQKYPAYSSKHFAGNYEDVREGKSEEILHDVEIYLAELLEMKEIGSEKLLEKVKEDISKVDGDFRQEEIVKIWQENLSGNSRSFQIATIRLSVSSGFYVRQFAYDLAEALGTSGLALSILREKVGEWSKKDCVL